MGCSIWADTGRMVKQRSVELPVVLLPPSVELRRRRAHLLVVDPCEERAGSELPVSVTITGMDRERSLHHAPSRLISLCLDANDPRTMGQFWAEALGWELHESDGEIALIPSDGTSFDILFEPTSQIKVGQNNIHLDLTTTSIEDQHDLVHRLIEAGAVEIDIGQRRDERHVVLADPEGNEFCIIEPDNNFLAGCPRLGAINADGTRETGLFWSEALGWPLIWDQDEETAIRAPDGSGPIIQWSGPPLMTKNGKNRLHLDIAPQAGVDQRDEVDRLTDLGATCIDIGQGDVSWIVMADPDNNEFCVVTPR